MKSTKLLTSFTVMLFLLASTGQTFVVNAALPNVPVNWETNEASMVYNVTTLDYNSGTSMPIFSEGEPSYQIGEIMVGDLMFLRPSLPSLNPGDTTVFVDLRSTGTNESWGFEYDGNFTLNPGWPVTLDGPIFLSPVVPVPSTYSQWADLETEWDTVLTATFDQPGETFTLTGTNSGLNVTSFTIVWDTITGVMLSYTTTQTENDGIPYNLTLEFLYFRDESEWEFTWGVDVGDLFTWDWTKVDLDGSPSVEFGGDNEGQQNYAQEGDLMLFKITDLGMPNDEGLHWNGSAMTQDWEMDFVFEFSEIGQSGDGPRVFYPILPIGNSYFYGNISHEFEATGATVDISNNLMNITYDIGGMRESGLWNLTTGLQMRMVFEGDIDSGHLVADIKLAYYRDLHGGTTEYSLNHFEERYVLDDLTNGTNDYLDFGLVNTYDNNGDEIQREFKLYEGDIFKVSGDFGFHDGEDNTWAWRGRSSSGYEIDATMNDWYPGFEFGDGPPGLFFIIPNTISGGTGAQGKEAYFVKVDRETTTQNYVVINDLSEFGFTTTQDGLTLTVRWDKETGLLNYYKVDGTDSDNGNHVTWEMHRSQYNVNDPSSLSWGIAVGTTMHYEVSNVIGSVPFGDTGSTLATGDLVDATFTHLGNFDDEGPTVTADLSLNGVVDANVEVGLREPGFEFVSFENEEGGGPPLIYFAIPKGNPDFYDMVAGMFADAGYSVVNNATHLGVTMNDPVIAGSAMDLDVQVYWEKSTGLMTYYSVHGIFDSEELGFTITLLGAEVITPTPSNSDTGPAFLPVSGTSILALPFIGFSAMIIRRKKSSI